MRYLLFLFLFIITITSAQTEIQKIERQIENTTQVAQKLKLLDDVCNLTLGKEHETFSKYANLFVDLAIKNEYYDMASQPMVLLYDTYYFYLNKKDSSANILNKALKYESFYKESKSIAQVYSRLGHKLMQDGNLEKAISSLDKSIIKYAEKDSLLKAHALVRRGIAHKTNDNLVNSIKDYETAIIFYENLDLVSRVISAKSNLANVYKKAGFGEDAINLWKEVINSKDDDNKRSYSFIANSYLSLAIEQGDLNIIKPDKEEFFLLKAIEYYNKAPFGKANLLLAYVRLAKFYAIHKNITKMDGYLQLAKAFYEAYNVNNQLSYFYNYTLAQIEKENKNYKKGIAILINEKKLGVNLRSAGEKKDVEWELYELYKNLSKEDIALTHLERYITLKDSVYNMEKSKSFLFYQQKYDAERKDRRIKEKEANITLLERDNSIKNNWLIFGGLGSLLIFGMLYILKEKRHSERSNKKSKEYAQNLILSQEEDRKRIASELHDSIGQQLLLIKNQSVVGNVEDVKNIVNQTIDEVRTISLNLHPYQLKEFGLTKAIIMNLKKFKKSTEAFVSFEVDPIDGLFEAVQEVNIFRIIQESISNIVKHSKASAIRLEITKSKEIVQIVINDNGVGYNFNKELSNKKSLGLKTLKERINLMKGNMIVTSEKNQGTKIEFLIPLK